MDGTEVYLFVFQNQLITDRQKSNISTFNYKQYFDTPEGSTIAYFSKKVSEYLSGLAT